MVRIVGVYDAALMRRILVTGARGFIARYVARQLASVGHEVVGVGRHGDPGGGPMEGLPRFVTCDLINVEQTAKLIADVDPEVAVHLAAHHVGLEGDSGERAMNDDLAMTANLLAALDRGRSARHILFASSAAVYDSSQPMPVRETGAIKPDSAYGTSKAAVEKLVHAFARGGRAATALRFANVVGPGERRPSVVVSVSRQIAEIEAGKRSGAIRHGRLDEARDLVDVRDVARAIASCCDLDSAGARTYNVGTGVAVAISDVVGALVGLAKVPVRLELDPSLVRGGPPSRIALDATALRTAVGWSPQVPLARSLAEGLDEWREQVRLR